jgi:pimeloyl-ACP methyl ester carboxylesterase
MRAPRVHSVHIAAGKRIGVRSWDGEGRPLVLLHGLLDSSEGWDRIAARTDRNCVAIDLPGFGGSHLPPRARMDAYADAVAAAMAAMRIERADVVGHSLGGAVAVELAERTELVASLALLAPTGFGAIRLAEVLTMPGIREVSTLALPLALVNPLTVTAAYAAFVAHRRLPERELVARLRARATHAPRGVRAATIAIAHAGRAPDALFRRPLRFAGPVSALWGEHDALVPHAHIDALRTALPHAHVEVWPGMGHHPQRERPRQLAHFLRLHDAARADAPPARPLRARTA